MSEPCPSSAEQEPRVSILMTDYDGLCLAQMERDRLREELYQVRKVIGRAIHQLQNGWTVCLRSACIESDDLDYAAIATKALSRDSAAPQEHKPIVKPHVSDSELAAEIAYLEALRLNPTGLSTREAYVLLALYELSDRRAFSANGSAPKTPTSGWRPIETAPLDGTEMLVIGTRHNMLVPNPHRHVASYRRGWWSGNDVLSHVTHWMPLEEMPGMNGKVESV